MLKTQNADIIINNVVIKNVKDWFNITNGCLVLNDVVVRTVPEELQKYLVWEEERSWYGMVDVYGEYAIPLEEVDNYWYEEDEGGFYIYKK